LLAWFGWLLGWLHDLPASSQSLFDLADRSSTQHRATMTISRQVAVAAIMVIVAVAAASDPSLTNTTNTTNTTTTATTTTTTTSTTNKVPPHHGNSSNANTLGTLKSGLMAGGWIPFTILVGVSFFFSFSYVRHYQHSKEREFGSTVITTLALAVGP
jgi:LMBR1 domain-containing protein 1